MTPDSWSEDARGIWQGQESAVTRLSAEDMRARADRWERAFDRTHWIAFACAGVLALFFGWMLVIEQAALQRLGATIGLASAVHLVAVGLRVAGRGWVEDGATCIRAYKAQLERRWYADRGAARTILLSMTGCALLTSPGDGASWALQAAGQMGAGVITYAYVSRQARRFRTRIDELTRLEGP
jgi:hypothetical protein